MSLDTGPLLDLHNALRGARGLPPLRRDPRLDAAAQKHAEDMAANRTCDHLGSDGSTPWDRISAAGYRYASATENLAALQATAEQAVEDWVADPPHAEAVYGAYEDLGVGAAADPSGVARFWCCVYATPARPAEVTDGA